MPAALAQNPEDGGQFKIHNTKASVRLAVGHIANVGIIMPHTEGFQLGKQLPDALRVQMFHPAAAVGGDDAELPRIGLEQPGYEPAVAGFEMTENPHLVREPRRRVRTMISLEHTAVEGEIHGRSQGVFDLQHRDFVIKVRQFYIC